ncbi:ADP-ribosylation factor GTPase-activating protein 3-like [Styela clava]
MSDEYEPHAVPASAIQSSQPKSTIIKKGNTRAKKGLGAKKTGGLGAQRVKKIDFSELEKNAEEADKAQMRLSVSSSGSDKKQNEKLTDTSRRLAYQDIEKQEKQVDKKLSAMDDRKKEQAVRLGMGMGKVEGVSHSMKIMTIDQTSPQDERPRRNRYRDDDMFFDAKSSRDHWMDDNDSDDDNNTWKTRDFSYKQTFSKNDTKTKPSRNDPPSYSIEPINDPHKNISSVIISNNARDENESSRQRKTQLVDKYSNSSAISSDMLFGDQDRSQHEQEQRMKSLEGRSAISSDDFFGGGQSSSSSSYNSQMPDLGNLKEGVRSVAGRMSSMVSGIASTIQDRYGT